MQDAEWWLLRRMTRSTLSTGLGPRCRMVVVAAGDAVYSLYRAGTKTPVGGEAEAGGSWTHSPQPAIIIRITRCPQTPVSHLIDLIVPVA